VLHRPVELAQYLSIRYSERLAAAESLNGLYKTELIRRRGPWRSLDDVEYATLEWVDWYNQQRLHSWCADLPPAEYEDLYYRQITDPARAASAQPSLH
jgi:putative transposase